jgi:hypothetical protein
MKNLLGLTLALLVALGAVLLAGRIFDLSSVAVSLICLGVGMAVTAIYDAHFGTR